jgi:hypothetical protein
VPEGDFELELPTPASPEDEDVFTLTLAFDDGTRRSARLGIVQGMLPGTEGSTRCIVPKDGRKWNTVRGRAVLPVPFGVKSFSVLVNGKEIANEDDLDGAKGWYAVSGLKTGDAIDVSLTADASHFVSALVCRNSNFSIIIR